MAGKRHKWSNAFGKRRNAQIHRADQGTLAKKASIDGPTFPMIKLSTQHGVLAVPQASCESLIVLRCASERHVSPSRIGVCKLCDDKPGCPRLDEGKKLGCLPSAEPLPYLAHLT
eukprot:2073064-Amphidinium_carterae.1